MDFPTGDLLPLPQQLGVERSARGAFEKVAPLRRSLPFAVSRFLSAFQLPIINRTASEKDRAFLAGVACRLIPTPDDRE